MKSCDVLGSACLLFWKKPTGCVPLVTVTASWCLWCSIEVTLFSKPEQEEAEADVGLQLKVNFSEKAVQRNACMGGKWGPSENTLSFFPFAPGEAFKVHVKFMIYMWHRWNYCPQRLHCKYVEKSIWIIQICQTLKDEISSILNTQVYQGGVSMVTMDEEKTSVV